MNLLIIVNSHALNRRCSIFKPSTMRFPDIVLTFYQNANTIAILAKTLMTKVYDTMIGFTPLDNMMTNP